MSDKLLQFLSYFRERNFYTPTTLIDIGAYQGTFTNTIRKAFSDLPTILIEPNHHQELEQIPNATWHQKVLYHSEVEVPWYSNNSAGDSVYKENTLFYTTINPTTVKATTLDTLLPTMPKDLFLKIDTQGAEIDIIRGGTNTLAKTTLLLLEVPLLGKYNNTPHTFQDYIDYVAKHNFTIFDMVDFIRAPFIPYTLQADMLFVNKSSKLYKHIMEDLETVLSIKF